MSLLTPIKNVSKILNRPNKLGFYLLTLPLLLGGLAVVKFSDEMIAYHHNKLHNTIKPGKEQVLKVNDALNVTLENRLKTNMSKHNVSFKQLNGGAQGQYLSKENTVVIDTSSQFSTYSLSNEGFFSKYLFNHFSVNGLIAHEKAHAKTFQIINELYANNELHNDFIDFIVGSSANTKEASKKIKKWQRQLILSEGIAEYTAILAGEESPLYYRDFLTDINEIYFNPLKFNPETDFKKYETSCQLGAAIARKIVTKEGYVQAIKDIFSNSIITEEELLDTDSYVSRIIDK